MNDHETVNYHKKNINSDVPFEDALRVWNKLDLLLELDNTSIQRLLKEIDLLVITEILTEASSRHRDKILSNCSTRLSELIEEDIKTIGSVSFIKVEENVDKVLEIIENLREAGEII